MVPFSNHEKTKLLKGHGIGPRIIERLEQIGICSLEQLAEERPEQICAQISDMLSSSCWRNNPQAHQSIQSAIQIAKKSLEVN